MFPLSVATGECLKTKSASRLQARVCSANIVLSLVFQQEETLEQLERNIKAAQEAALEAAETDSVVTGTSATGGQEGATRQVFTRRCSTDACRMRDADLACVCRVGDVDAQSVTSLGAGENITIAEDSEISMRPDENLDFSGQLPRGGVSTNGVFCRFLDKLRVEEHVFHPRGVL